MTWFVFASRNARRRPLRAIVTIAGVAVAVAALSSLIGFESGYDRGLRRELDRLGAHILVVPKGCPYDAASIALHGASWPCYLRASYLKEVAAVPGVACAAPVFMTAHYDERGEPHVFVGVTSNLLALKPAWRIDGGFPTRAGEVLVGAEAARRHGWRVGDEVPLPGSRGGSGRVSGILAPIHGAEDAFIHLRLEDAQLRFGHPQELTHILVRLTDPDRLDEVVRQLRGCDAGLSMNVVPLTHLFATIRGLMSAAQVWLGCVAAVALLIAGAGVGNTVLMAVLEQTREIGVLRALGASRSDIARLVLIETAHLCLAGGAVGVLLAFGASRSVEAWLRTRLPFAPSGGLVQWEWWILFAALGVALGLGAAAAVWPAWRAARVTPIEAMRHPEAPA